jgi:nucleotide-binding universal stress UspA family protein
MSNELTWVVGLDLSDLSEKVLDYALAEMEARGGGTLVISHAVPPALPPSYGFELPASALTLYDEAHAEAESRASKGIEGLLNKAKAEHPNLTIETVVHTGEAADEILACAKARGAERIIVGSLGRTGIQRLLLGSVAERVARLSEIPVLIVK